MGPSEVGPRVRMSDLVPVRGPVRVGDYVELGAGRIAAWSCGLVERIAPTGHLEIAYGPRDWPEYLRSHNLPVDPREVVRAWRRVFTSNSHEAVMALPDGGALAYRTERRWAWARVTLDAPGAARATPTDSGSGP